MQRGTFGWEMIASAARAARDLMIRDPQAGEAAFERLITMHPADGMVYLSRGQAYEALEQYANAVADYERAENCFPLARWRETAYNARVNLERILASALAESAPPVLDEHPEGPETRREPGQAAIPSGAADEEDGTRDETSAAIDGICARLEKLPGIDERVNESVRLAFEDAETAPGLAASALRHGLQIVVARLRGEDEPQGSLVDMIDGLAGRVPDVIVSHMHTVRRLGNVGARGGEMGTPDVLVGLGAMLRVLEWCHDRPSSRT